MVFTREVKHICWYIGFLTGPFWNLMYKNLVIILILLGKRTHHARDMSLFMALNMWARRLHGMRRIFNASGRLPVSLLKLWFEL